MFHLDKFTTVQVPFTQYKEALQQNFNRAFSSAAAVLSRHTDVALQDHEDCGKQPNQEI